MGEPLVTLGIQCAQNRLQRKHVAHAGFTEGQQEVTSLWSQGQHGCTAEERAVAVQGASQQRPALPEAVGAQQPGPSLLRSHLWPQLAILRPREVRQALPQCPVPREEASPVAWLPTMGQETGKPPFLEHLPWAGLQKGSPGRCQGAAPPQPYVGPGSHHTQELPTALLSGSCCSLCLGLFLSAPAASSHSSVLAHSALRTVPPSAPRTQPLPASGPWHRLIPIPRILVHHPGTVFSF